MLRRNLVTLALFSALALFVLSCNTDDFPAFPTIEPTLLVITDPTPMPTPTAVPTTTPIPTQKPIPTPTGTPSPPTLRDLLRDPSNELAISIGRAPENEQICIVESLGMNRLLSLIQPGIKSPFFRKGEREAVGECFSTETAQSMFIDGLWNVADGLTPETITCIIDRTKSISGSLTLGGIPGTSDQIKLVHAVTCLNTGERKLYDRQSQVLANVDSMECIIGEVGLAGLDPFMARSGLAMAPLGVHPSGILKLVATEIQLKAAKVSTHCGVFTEPQFRAVGFTASSYICVLDETVLYFAPLFDRILGNSLQIRDGAGGLDLYENCGVDFTESVGMTRAEYEIQIKESIFPEEINSDSNKARVDEPAFGINGRQLPCVNEWFGVDQVLSFMEDGEVATAIYTEISAVCGIAGLGATPAWLTNTESLMELDYQIRQ